MEIVTFSFQLSRRFKLSDPLPRPVSVSLRSSEALSMGSKSPNRLVLLFQGPRTLCMYMTSSMLGDDCEYLMFYMLKKKRRSRCIPVKYKRYLAVALFLGLVISVGNITNYIEHNYHIAMAWYCFGSQPFIQWIPALIFRPSSLHVILRWIIASIIGVLLLMFFSFLP